MIKNSNKIYEYLNNRCKNRGFDKGRVGWVNPVPFYLQYLHRPSVPEGLPMGFLIRLNAKKRLSKSGGFLVSL